MIVAVWVLYSAITVVNLAILLNFIVAFVVEAFEEVYGRDVIDDFINRAQMNDEHRLLIRQFRKIGQHRIGKHFSAIWSTLYFIVSFLMCCFWCCFGCLGKFKVLSPFDQIKDMSGSKDLGFDYMVLAISKDYSKEYDSDEFKGIVKTLKDVITDKTKEIK